MEQRQPFSEADDMMWLSSLVDTFGRTERLHDEKCDAAEVAAAMARLQRPAASARRQHPMRRAELLRLSF